MDSVLKNNKTSATELIASIGKVFILPNEAAINYIIVVAVSANTYFFLFIELIQ